MSSTVVVLPLTKNKELAALVADKEMGARLYGCFTIKAKDDQSVSIRLEEMTDKISDLPEPGEDDDDEYEKEEANEGDSNGSTVGESEEAEDLASPGGMMTP